jgi:hypothetical protein
MAVSSGKWYWESQITSVKAGVSARCAGVISPELAINHFQSYLHTVSGMKGAVYNSYTGKQCVDAAGWAAYGASWGVGDVVGVALDCDARQITFYKNNASQGIIPLSSSVNFWVPYEGNTGDYNISAVNFGQGGQTGIVYDAASGGRFKYTPPAGFKALCTANLAAPTIKNSSRYFNAVTYTGNGYPATGTQSVTGLSFAPGLVWMKDRDRGTQEHHLEDSVRGAQNKLSSCQTAAESTSSTYLTAFNSNGFSVGTDGTVNYQNDRFIAWCWKAGDAGVSNNSGTITSQVSANPTSGFSVVAYTGNGTVGATVGHGLGAAPKMIVVKRKSSGTDYGWRVWHAGIGRNDTYMILNTTEAANPAHYTSDWNDVAPGSSVFTLGAYDGASNAPTNANGQSYIAYLWAEVAGFSKFGSYAGNGSADGPFVYCGFKPRYLMVKRMDSAQSWVIVDSARDVANPVGSYLLAESGGAEPAKLTIFDHCSNGFKVRCDSSLTGINASGGTYIFAAFAEAPFKYATAR